MHEPRTTVTGHLAAAPKLRTSKQGHSVADFRIAHTPRVQHGEGWVDGETIWFKVTVWRGQAEHVATSLRKGDRVMVEGRLTQHSWTDSKGELRTDLEIDASEVGLGLMYHRATSHRTSAPPRSTGEVDFETGEVLMADAARPLVDLEQDVEQDEELQDELEELEADELVAG